MNTEIIEGEYVEITSTEQLIKFLKEESGVSIDTLDGLLQYLKNTGKAFFVLKNSKVLGGTYMSKKKSEI